VARKRQVSIRIVLIGHKDGVEREELDDGPSRVWPCRGVRLEPQPVEMGSVRGK
jgi:hypothetical protein